MIILGIETSCDETAVAILKISRNNSEILSNFVFSQIKIHRRFGGVVPKIAGREHLKKIIPLLNKALLKSKIKPKDIDLIAVTSLFIGMSAAKTLSYVWQKPIVGINHIEAHLFANFICEGVKNIKFPAIGLIVSGGHTQLILIKDFLKYKLLGETLDDAAGECFDKTARILGLGYPGGPAIAEQAAKLKAENRKLKVSLPRPMINSKNFDFSFSGLKTAVLYDFKKRSSKEKKSKKYIQEISWEIQQAIIDVLILKTIKATGKYQAKTILLGGGVIANKELRKQFRVKIRKKVPNFKFSAFGGSAVGGQVLIPNLKFCGDNAAMIALLGFYYFNAGKIDNWENLKIKPDLRLI
jgi:N6-L-threonylcarbamoyladenine synthase